MLHTLSSGGADAGAMQSLREDLAEAKSTIKSKEKDASEAVNKAKDLEKKVGEQSCLGQDGHTRLFQASSSRRVISIACTACRLSIVKI